MPRFVRAEVLFKGRHSDQEIVVLCVRWYLGYKLSYRDPVAMMGERGIGLTHTTILRARSITPRLNGAKRARALPYFMPSILQ
jgi:transposase-like protein